MSLNHGIALYRDLKEEFGPQHFERNVKSTLRNCLNSFQQDFECEKVFWKDSKNKRILSTLTWASDVEDLAARVIKGGFPNNNWHF